MIPMAVKLLVMEAMRKAEPVVVGSSRSRLITPRAESMTSSPSTTMP